MVFNRGNSIALSDQFNYTRFQMLFKKGVMERRSSRDRRQFTLTEVKCKPSFIAVFSSENVVKESQRYFEKRALSSSKIYTELCLAGLPISGAANIKNLTNCTLPVIVANADLYSAEELKIIENYMYPLVL